MKITFSRRAKVCRLTATFRVKTLKACKQVHATHLGTTIKTCDILSYILWSYLRLFKVGKWPIHVQVSHYAGVACKRLERIGFGGKKQPRKPSTEDIDQARVSWTHYNYFLRHEYLLDFEDWMLEIKQLNDDGEESVYKLTKLFLSILLLRLV